MPQKTFRRSRTLGGTTLVIGAGLFTGQCRGDHAGVIVQRPDQRMGFQERQRRLRTILTREELAHGPQLVRTV